MKVQVVRVDGSVEAIELVGRIIVKEPEGGLGMISLESTGADHYFTKDGQYDGWGLAVSGLDESEATSVADAIERNRQVFPKGEGH